MPTLRFQDRSYELADGETVLDCLLRHGCEIPFSCKSGACQACLMRSPEGELDPRSQHGLNAALQQQRYFLACRCKPQEEMFVALPGLDELTVSAVVTEVRALCHNVRGLFLEPSSPFECAPGQYLSLINPEGTTRSYSIANDPVNDGHIELHVRLLPDGRMSRWVERQASSGQQVHIRGPAGSCCYVGGEQKQAPILMGGTGTGLAPLLGVLRDALENGHRGPISLVHGALNPRELYYVDQLRSLEQQHAVLTYIPCVLVDNDPGDWIVADVEDVVLERLADPDRTHVYLCGAPEFVRPTRKKVFLKGVASGRIYCDAFVLTPSEAVLTTT